MVAKSGEAKASLGLASPLSYLVLGIGLTSLLAIKLGDG